MADTRSKFAATAAMLGAVLPYQIENARPLAVRYRGEKVKRSHARPCYLATLTGVKVWHRAQLPDATAKALLDLFQLDRQAVLLVPPIR